MKHREIPGGERIKEIVRAVTLKDLREEVRDAWENFKSDWRGFGPKRERRARGDGPYGRSAR